MEKIENIKTKSSVIIKKENLWIIIIPLMIASVPPIFVTFYEWISDDTKFEILSTQIEYSIIYLNECDMKESKKKEILSTIYDSKKLLEIFRDFDLASKIFESTKPKLVSCLSQNHYIVESEQSQMSIFTQTNGTFFTITSEEIKNPRELIVLTFSLSILTAASTIFLIRFMDQKLKKKVNAILQTLTEIKLINEFQNILMKEVNKKSNLTVKDIDQLSKQFRKDILNKINDS